MRTGNFLFEQRVKRDEPSGSIHVSFSNEGDFVILSSGNQPDADKPLAILKSSDLLPAQYCIGKELNWAYQLGYLRGPGFVYWSSDLGTHVWDITSKPPKLLAGLILRPLKKEDNSRRETLIIMPTGDRAIVRRQDWRKELYNLNDGQKIGELDPHNTDWGISPTIDGGALLVQFTDGVSWLYSSESGRMLAKLPNSTNLIAFHDPECHRVTVWSQDGLILRYDESLKILGRWVWPMGPCHD